MKKILFLYTELAEYVLASMEATKSHNVALHIVRWPVNKEAPFEFRNLENATIYDRDSLTDEALLELAKEINPDVILTSGWVDKGYLKVNKAFFKKCPTVLLLDNQYTGDLKQKVAAFISPFWLRKMFSNAWVPGTPQFIFAQKLGFPEASIKRGFYCADTTLFDQFYTSYPERKTALPTKFIYVGRYVDFKGIEELWSAFTRFKTTYPSWELICIGTGDLFDQKVEAEGIHHRGFVQPSDLKEHLKDAGVFVLPSRKEPWGVVVHEMAAAGFPIICSNTIGAASRFLEEGENGFIFEANNEESLYQAMVKIAAISPTELLTMSEKSRTLAMDLTPEKWAKTLLSFIPSTSAQ